MAIDRRRFLFSSFSAAIVATAGSNVRGAGSGQVHRPEPLFTLYDARFSTAHRAALIAANGSPLRATTGDITRLLPEISAFTRAHSSFHLAGVTTESVPFCLQQFVRANGTSNLFIKRIDRDLFDWRFEVRGVRP